MPFEGVADLVGTEKEGSFLVKVVLSEEESVLDVVYESVDIILDGFT